MKKTKWFPKIKNWKLKAYLRISKLESRNTKSSQSKFEIIGKTIFRRNFLSKNKALKLSWELRKIRANLLRIIIRKWRIRLLSILMIFRSSISLFMKKTLCFRNFNPHWRCLIRFRRIYKRRIGQIRNWVGELRNMSIKFKIFSQKISKYLM